MNPAPDDRGDAPLRAPDAGVAPWSWGTAARAGRWVATWSRGTAARAGRAGDSDARIAALWNRGRSRRTCDRRSPGPSALRRAAALALAVTLSPGKVGEGRESRQAGEDPREG